MIRLHEVPWHALLTVGTVLAAFVIIVAIIGVAAAVLLPEEGKR